jgi:hypothetical protein
LACALGKVDIERVAALDAHLDVCPDCRAVIVDVAAGSDAGLPHVRTLATFAPSEVVAGRYVVRKRLAVGGMGEVYEALDSWVDEAIAIKTVVATIADNDSALGRLRAEVRLARRVTHPNVCRVYDLGFHRAGREQVAFLTMELLRGVTLRQRLLESGRIAPSDAFPLIRQMVAGLSHAHAAGIVHRDFKSDNVMLVPDADGLTERVVLMDFGLARSALVSESHPLTPNSHTVLGTLDYMSPEQVQGATAVSRSDVYALGVVIYEMLTGSLPFHGGSPLARALRRVTHAAPLLSAALPGIDRRWEAAVARCLATEPGDRFANVDDLCAALAVARTQTRYARRGRLVAVASLTLPLGVVAAAHLRASAGGRAAASSPPSLGASVASPVKAIPQPPPLPGVPAPVRDAGTPSGERTAKPRATGLRPRTAGAPEQPAMPQNAPVSASPPPRGDALLDPFVGSDHETASRE